MRVLAPTPPWNIQIVPHLAFHFHENSRGAAPSGNSRVSVPSGSVCDSITGEGDNGAEREERSIRKTIGLFTVHPPALHASARPARPARPARTEDATDVLFFWTITLYGGLTLVYSTLLGPSSSSIYSSISSPSPSVAVCQSAVRFVTSLIHTSPPHLRAQRITRVGVFRSFHTTTVTAPCFASTSQPRGHPGLDDFAVTCILYYTSHLDPSVTTNRRLSPIVSGESRRNHLTTPTPCGRDHAHLAGRG